LGRQVRLVLEDAAQCGRLDIMEDELQRYAEYRQFADAGVQAAWDTLQAVVADIRQPPKLAAGQLLDELRAMQARVLSLECESSEVKTLLRRAANIPSLRAARESLEAEFDRA
jgi:hypothetical protein